MILEPGGWVRFIRDGRLVIDEVLYVKSIGSSHITLYTPCYGEVTPHEVIEVRYRGDRQDCLTDNAKGVGS